MDAFFWTTVAISVVLQQKSVGEGGAQSSFWFIEKVENVELLKFPW